MSKTRRLLMLLPLAVLSASLAGCGTLITLIEGPVNFDNKAIAYAYSGTRFSLGGARKSPVAFIFVIDVPFSVVGDTAVLPIRLVQSLYFRLFGDDKPVEVLEPEAT
jgi:uncharacterized protein YceK